MKALYSDWSGVQFWVDVDKAELEYFEAHWRKTVEGVTVTYCNDQVCYLIVNEE